MENMTQLSQFLAPLKAYKIKFLLDYKTTTVKKQSSFLCQMIENEFASFDRSIESFFDAAKKKKWRCQIEKREQCNQMVKKASFIKVEKTFHLTRCVS